MGIIACFRLGGRDIADGFEQPSVIEPIYPFQGGVLDGLERAPRPTPMDHLGLEQADDRLRQRVIVRIADAADGRFDAGLSEALGVADADVLRAAVGMFATNAVGLVLRGPLGGIGSTTRIIATLTPLAQGGRHSMTALMAAGGWASEEVLREALAGLAPKLGVIGLRICRRKAGVRMTKVR